MWEYVAPCLVAAAETLKQCRGCSTLPLVWCMHAHHASSNRPAFQASGPSTQPAKTTSHNAECSYTMPSTPTTIVASALPLLGINLLRVLFRYLGSSQHQLPQLHRPPSQASQRCASSPPAEAPHAKASAPGRRS